MQTRFQTMVYSVAAAALLVGVAGCATRGDRTVGRVIDDRRITANVKGALNDATVYKFDDVNVTTFDGVVQLSGWATTEDQKARAAEIAQRVEGVREVVNNITLKLAPTGRDEGYPYRRDLDRRDLDRDDPDRPRRDAPVRSSDEPRR